MIVLCFQLFGAAIQPTSPGISSYEQALSKDGAKFPGDKSGGNQTRRGIQTHGDGASQNGFSQLDNYTCDSMYLWLGLKGIYLNIISAKIL